MICEHCGFPLARHVTEELKCIGANNTFRARVDNITATFLYKNVNGFGQSYETVIMQDRRPMARIENVVDRLMREGNTEISVNITHS